MAALAAHTATGTISAPLGWTLIRRDMSGNLGGELSQALYYRVSGPSEPRSYTWSFDWPVSANGAILAYGGVKNRRPVDSHAGVYTPDAATFAAPSVRTPMRGELVLAFYGSTGTNGITAPRGMVERFDLIGDDLGLEGATYVAKTAGATGVKRAGDSAGAENSSNFGQLVALRPACSGTTGRPRLGQRPVILGQPIVGRRVQAFPGTWCGKRPMRLAYRWQRCGAKGCVGIRRATGTAYRPTTKDLGASLTFTVTARSVAGSTTVKSSSKQVGRTRPTNTSLPTISGTAKEGFELTASTGSWTGLQPMAYAYQWRRCDASGSGCASVSGANNSTYVLTSADVDGTMRVVVTATNSSGSKSATSGQSAAVTPAASAATALSNSAIPTVSGSASQGSTLTGSNGTWSGTAPITYAYEWQRCESAGSNCATLSGATTQTYTLGTVDVGSTLRVLVTASNDAGSSSAASLATPVVVAAATPPLNTTPPTITGEAAVGSLLSASTGTWTGTTPITYAYQWRRCDRAGVNCVSISGATGASYQVSYADGGSTLRVLVTASNPVGSNVATSAQSAVVTTPVSSIYWGAGIDGPDTYGSLYGGTWGNPPWDSTTWDLFESHAGKKVSILSWSNAKPWNNDFNYYLSMQEKVRSRGDLSLISMNSGSVPLRDIANGLYDSSLKTWAQQAAAWGHPFFLRWDWEMNGNWFPWSPGVNGNTAGDYVNAWRHFHDLAVQAGAGNVTWVWCPNVDPNSTGYWWTPYEQLYPGDAYVDWTCLDGYNKGPIFTPPGWQSASTVFASSYNKLLQLAPTKPIMIGETSSEENGGSKAAWITDLLGTQLPVNFPKIKALVWFNWRCYDPGLRYYWPFEIESSSAAQAAFATGIAAPYYAPGGGFGDLPLGSKIRAP